MFDGSKANLMMNPVNKLNSRKLTSIQRKGGERTLAKLEGRIVHIWSGEHFAWWREGLCGYTTNMTSAGLYPFAEALEATYKCGPEKKIVFQIVDEF